MLKYFFRLLCFGLWGAVVFVGGAPIYLLFWGNRKLNFYFGRILGWPLRTLLGMRLVVQNGERLTERQPCIYVANHQSAIEVLIFGSLVPRGTVVVGKKQVRWIPFFGLYFVSAGNVLIDRKKSAKAVSALTDLAERVKATGISVFMFPEGTRNTGNEPLLPFKKGPFHLAIEAQLPIVPMVASSLKEIWNAEKRLSRSGEVRIQVLPPIETQGMTSGQVDALCAQVRTQMAEAIRSF